ncbi:hypothetical protein FYK55_12715 [Roseiconus nitratireducens]|uniref:Uncharacterized protein n=1 Tax=Roseiconus nitratireducens TaxID=2605748 RepID=A0A5M6DAU6_9BACT|nr:hypothetical protein [Roseiconus nitratireducens]KAA5543139.1 hypothetical protein FYK55_12715 [Roseiconus nitratireducens]
MSDHDECAHLGPYDQDHAVIFHDLGPGQYSFHVIELSELTLGFIQNPKMAIFKLPRHRCCLATVYTTDSMAHLCFEVKLLPESEAAATQQAPTATTSSSSSSNYCYHQGCEPYQIECPPGQVPACEVREVIVGDVTTQKTVMHCVTPNSSSSSSSR